MCSLRFSPVPTPNSKRPGSIAAEVAVAWAMTAGWMRIVGQVTPVTTLRRVTWESAPITPHTNGLWPCSSFQG